MEYNLLWFDDEHHKFEIFKNRALHNNLIINGVSNAAEGLEILKANKEHFDAVILDGLFYTDSKKVKDDLSEDAFGSVAKYLSETKSIPWFIYSGKTSFVKDNNSIVNIFTQEKYGSKKVYDKNEPDDENLLFQDIIKAANGNHHTQLKNKYYPVFEIFRNNYINSVSENELLNMIEKLEEQNFATVDYNPLNSIRKILESLIDVAYAKNLIPAELKTSKGELTSAAYFLCDKHTQYNLTTEYFHPTLCSIFLYLLSICQDGSHNRTEMKLKVEDFVKNHSTYLFMSSMYNLFDLIIGFNRLFKKHESNEIPSLSWNKMEVNNIYEGQLEQDTNGNYHCGEYLLEYNKIHGIHSPGSMIRITSELNNTNFRTKHLYPKFAVRFELIKQ